MEPIGAPRGEAESSHVPSGRKASLWYQLFFSAIWPLTTKANQKC